MIKNGPVSNPLKIQVDWVCFILGKYVHLENIHEVNVFVSIL